VSCAVGLPGTLDQAAVGDARLDSGETGDILDRVEPPQSPDVADTGDGAPARQRDRIMAVGSLLDRALSRGEQRIVNVDPCQVHGHVLLHAGLIEALEEAAAVLGRGEAAQGFTEVMLAGGILDVRAPLCPLVHEMMAAAHKIARGAHPPRVDGGLGNESSASPRRDLVRVDAVVLGVAAVHRPPVEGMSQDDRNPLVLAEIGEPGPR
jgi:hypothetical protein